MLISETDDTIHGWFGLSYSTHLVLDQEVLAGQSEDWQREIAAMLGQLQEAFPNVNRHGDEILALAGEIWECSDLTDEQLRAGDISSDDGDAEDSICEHEHEDADAEWWCKFDQMTWYDWRGDEIDRQDQVIIPLETLTEARAANRIVIPRTLLQSMPGEWQQRFVGLASRVERQLADRPTYDIRFYTADGHRTTDPIPHYNRGRTRLESALA
jgi:hypothetical protein